MNDGSPDAPHGAIFVSYASDDAHLAERLIAALRGRGLTVRSHDDIPAGDVFFSAIERAIADAAAFVPIVTPHSSSSNSFSTEVSLAIAEREHDTGKRIIPLMVSGTRELPYFLRQYQGITFTPERPEAAAFLVDAALRRPTEVEPPFGKTREALRAIGTAQRQVEARAARFALHEVSRTQMLYRYLTDAASLAFFIVVPALLLADDWSITSRVPLLLMIGAGIGRFVWLDFIPAFRRWLGKGPAAGTREVPR